MGTTFVAMYWSDFIADTVHLNSHEMAAYTRLLGHYYQRGGQFRYNPTRLSRLTQGDEQVIEDIVEEYFDVIDGRLHHHRADAEIQKSADRVAKAKAAANKRWDARSNAQAMPKQCSGIDQAYAPAMQPDPDPDCSVSNDTDDPIKTYFDHGVRMLIASGKTSQQARKILGKLRAVVGDKEAFQVLKVARDKSDPAGYLMACKAKQKLPWDEKDLLALVARNGWSQARPGESMDQYRSRLTRELEADPPESE